MRAIRVHAFGGPEAMQLEELPDPTPGPNEVRLRIHAAGVNFIDIYQRSGQYPNPLPFAPGLEGAGTVEALGPGVTEVKAGQRVAWARVSGSYATHAIARPELLVPLPDALSFEQGAAAMLQGMTAHFLSASAFPLGIGHTAVVHAAAGGVGQLLLQLAAQRGAHTLGVVSTPAKAETARAAGATEVALAGGDWVAAARALTGGKGADVVYDGVGKDTFLRSIDALAPRGMMVLYGQSSGPVAPFDPQLLNQKGSLFLTRPSLHHYTATRPELLARAAEILGAIAEGRLKLAIERRYPLAEARQAHADLASRKTQGKLVLDLATA
jgi:NADPH2:quinone reductase